MIFIRDTALFFCSLQVGKGEESEVNVILEWTDTAVDIHAVHLNTANNKDGYYQFNVDAGDGIIMSIVYSIENCSIQL